MVYRIRNKNLFMTAHGYKNNYFHNVLIMPKPVYTETTFALKTRFDHHSFLRMFQLYRNISRHSRQYFYGCKDSEESLVLALRSAFTLPFRCETPVHLIKHGGERRFADQGDRDFELISHNLHPHQHAYYEVKNQEIRDAVETEALHAKGEKTVDEQAMDYFEKLVQKEQAANPGKAFTFDQFMEIFKQVIRRKNQETRLPTVGTDSGNGTQDFQEVRRPFIAPNNDAVSH